MNAPKYGAKGNIKKSKREDAVRQISATLDSIETDLCNGKLKKGEHVHPFYRLDDEWRPELRLSRDNLSELLFERLRMQGFVLYFDEKVMRESLAQGEARLQGLL